MSNWNVSFEFSFCGGKTRFTQVIAANKRANSHNFKIKHLNLLTITFLAIYSLNRGKSSYTVFEENIVVTVLAKLVPLFLQKCACPFFSYALSNCRCQIVKDTWKNYVLKIVSKPFKSRQWKCFGETSLVDLHCLYFNYHLFAQKLFSLTRILQ